MDFFYVSFFFLSLSVHFFPLFFFCSSALQPKESKKKKKHKKKTTIKPLPAEVFKSREGRGEKKKALFSFFIIFFLGGGECFQPPPLPVLGSRNGGKTGKKKAARLVWN